MVKKHAEDQEALLAQYEKKAKLKMERRLRGDEVHESRYSPADTKKKNIKDIEKLRMSNIKQYRREMRRIKKEKRKEYNEARIARGEIIDTVPLTPEQRKEKM